MLALRGAGVRPPDPRADPLRGPPRALVRVPTAVCGRGLKSPLWLTPWLLYSELMPRHKQVTPTDRYCSFRCAAGYEPTPQADFDERVRAGSAVTFEGGQGASQTLDLGGAAAMKQVLPLGEGLLFFVSNANQVSAAFSKATQTRLFGPSDAPNRPTWEAALDVVERRGGAVGRAAAAGHGPPHVRFRHPRGSRSSLSGLA